MEPHSVPMQRPKIYLNTMLTSLVSAIFLISCSQHPMDFTITNGNTSIEIHAGYGGRISQVFSKGKPILSQKGELADFYGSVWWPSPQAKWDWPPPKTINAKPYDTLKIDNGYQLKSQTCKQSGLQVTKEVQLLNENHIKLTYRAKNMTDEVNKMAHWEITRLPKDGRIVFPAGANYTQESLPVLNPTFAYPTNEKPLDHLRDQSGNYFDFTVNNDQILGDDIRKLNADCANGWSAFLNDGFILIKVIKDIPLSAIAPEEGEVQVYISPDLPYIEFEQQSDYIALAPNQSSEWTVDWLIFEFAVKETPIADLDAFVLEKIAAFGL